MAGQAGLVAEALAAPARVHLQGGAPAPTLLAGLRMHRGAGGVGQKERHAKGGPGASIHQACAWRAGFSVATCTGVVIMGTEPDRPAEYVQY